MRLGRNLLIQGEGIAGRPVALPHSLLQLLLLQLPLRIVSGLHRCSLLGNVYDPVGWDPHRHVLGQAAADVRQAELDVDLGSLAADCIALLGPAELAVGALCEAVDVYL